MIRWRRRRMYVDDLPKPHDAWFLLAFLVILVLAFGAVYAVGYVVAGDKVPPGTTVAGLKIGGMSRAEAAAALHRRLDERLHRVLHARAGGHRLSFVPAEAGIRFDADATLDVAMDGSDWDPRHMLKVLEGGDAVDPVFVVNRPLLAAALAPLSSSVEASPVSSRVSILGGRAVLHPGRPGAHLDLAAAPGRVSAALADDKRFVNLPVADEAPPVTFHDVVVFARTTIRPALSAPVVVRVAGHRLRVTPAQFAPALRIGSAGGRLRLTVAPKVLAKRTQGLLSSLPGRPLDASIVFPNGRPVVVPGRSGHTVDKQAWARALLAAATSDDRQATARLIPSAPSFTTADARALHIRSDLGAGASAAGPRFAAAMRIAAVQLNGTVVLPGADFSYVHAVGPVSAGTVLSPLGIATQTAATRAQMAVIRRPAGVSIGRDLRFRNTSNFPVYIRAWASRRPHGGVSVAVQIWGTRASGG